jgi:hypothetical protein
MFQCELLVDGRVYSSWEARSYDELHWLMAPTVKGEKERGTKYELGPVIFREELPVNERLLEEYMNVD